MKAPNSPKRTNHVWFNDIIAFLLCLIVIIFPSCQKDNLLNQDTLNGVEKLSTTTFSNNTSVVYFGHKKFTRITGAPFIVTQKIENPYFKDFDGKFTLKIQNGSDKKTRVSSAEIRIDGVLIAGPSDFSNNVTLITKQLNGLKSSSVLAVKLNSAPGSFIDLWIEGSIKPEYSVVEQAYPDDIGELVDFIVNEKTITCQKINGEYIFQGDIILTEEQLKTNIPSKGAGGGEFIKRWPSGIIYYKINPNIPVQGRITDAIEEIEKETNIKFLERTNELYYVEFVHDAEGCSSNLGYLGNRFIPQKIRISDSGTKGNVMHEIGHTLGLIHEHSRSDRDAYVMVFIDRIKFLYESNFDLMEPFWKTDQFDFGSIMMYSSYAWSKNGLPTITLRDRITTWQAQRNKLSPNDIEAINLMYDISYTTILTNYITDARDGVTYKTVKIGTQWWMAENLAFLPSIRPITINSNTGQLFYVNNFDGTDILIAKAHPNYGNYGVLYNWPAAMNNATSSDAIPSGVKGVCPDGWHLPSNAEWTKLSDYLGGEAVAGGKMKSIFGWDSPNYGATNASGFSGLAGGAWFDGSGFETVGKHGFWWSSTEFNASTVWIRDLYNNNNILFRGNQQKLDAYSIRCVKD